MNYPFQDAGGTGPTCARSACFGRIQPIEMIAKSHEDEGIAFLQQHFSEEGALETTVEFCDESSLHHARTQRPGDIPTETAGILAAVDSVKLSRDGSRTDAKLIGAFAAWLTAAVHVLPAVLLLSHGHTDWSRVT